MHLSRKSIDFKKELYRFCQGDLRKSIELGTKTNGFGKEIHRIEQGNLLNLFKETMQLYASGEGTNAKVGT